MTSHVVTPSLLVTFVCRGRKGTTGRIAVSPEMLSKRELWDKVTNTFSTEANLFWIALPHYEGELRIGLGATTCAEQYLPPSSSATSPPPSQASNLSPGETMAYPVLWLICRLDDWSSDIVRSDEVVLSVDWYDRKAYKPGTVDAKNGVMKGFFWGIQPAFKRSVQGWDTDGKPIYLKTNAKFGSLLPVPVTVSSSSSNSEPKPEQRCVALLMKYCKEYSLKNPQVEPLWQSVEDALSSALRFSSDAEDEVAEREEGKEGGRHKGLEPAAQRGRKRKLKY